MLGCSSARKPEVHTRTYRVVSGQRGSPSGLQHRQVSQISREAPGCLGGVWRRRDLGQPAQIGRRIGRRHSLGEGGGGAQEERKNWDRAGGKNSAAHSPNDKGTNQAGCRVLGPVVFLAVGTRLMRGQSEGATSRAPGSPRAPPLSRAACMSLVSGFNCRSLHCTRFANLLLGYSRGSLGTRGPSRHKRHRLLRRNACGSDSVQPGAGGESHHFGRA